MAIYTDTARASTRKVTPIRSGAPKGHRCPRTLLRLRVERSIAHSRRPPAHRPDSDWGLAQPLENV